MEKWPSQQGITEKRLLLLLVLRDLHYSSSVTSVMWRYHGHATLVCAILLLKEAGYYLREVGCCMPLRSEFSEICRERGNRALVIVL